MCRASSGPENDHVRVVLDVRRGDLHSQRSLTAPDCTRATDAAVVVLAMVVGPSVGELEPAAAAPTSTTPDDGPREADADRQPEARPVRSATVKAGLGGFLDSATLPAAAPGAFATIACDGPRYGVQGGVGGTTAAEGVRRTTLDGRTLGVDASLWFGGVRGEVHSGGRSLEVAATAGADVGLIHATGRGAWTTQTTQAFWMAFAVGPAARVRLHERLSLRTALEAIVPLARPTFAIDPSRCIAPRRSALAAR